MQYVHNCIEERKDFILYLQDIFTDSGVQMNAQRQYGSCLYQLVENKFSKDLVKQKQDPSLYLHAISELSKFDSAMTAEYSMASSTLLSSRLFENSSELEYFSRALLESKLS
jgi:hypothetical protein